MARDARMVTSSLTRDTWNTQDDRLGFKINKFGISQGVSVAQAAPKTARTPSGLGSAAVDKKPGRSKGMPELTLGGSGTGVDANPPECGLSDREQRLLDGRPVGIYMTESAAEAARDRPLGEPSTPTSDHQP